MTVPAPGPFDPSGRLHVEVDDESGVVKYMLPIVVRDANGAFRNRLSSGSIVRLSPGLYSVAAVTSDGESAVKHVHIERGETTSVTFEASETGFLEGAGIPAYVFASVEFTDGCRLAAGDAKGWVFEPMDHLDRVPSAVFRVEDRRILMSLPLNPRDSYPRNSCRVDVVWTGDRRGLRMSFPPERRPARLIDGLVRHGEIAAEVDLLREATDLLSDKYLDPPGAVLGGLTLDRMGRLRQRLAWVENLARDFAWLADAPVLLASLLRHEPSPEERQRGLRLLLAAASERPLYTDGLSLLMELLRRWPDEASRHERRDMLDGLAGYSAYADWGSVNLSVELPSG